MISPDKADGLYFSFDDNGDTKTIFTEGITTYFDAAVQWKTYSNKVNEGDHAGIWRWKNSTWEFREACSGDNGYPALAVGKYQIRMKYLEQMIDMTQLAFFAFEQFLHDLAVMG